MTTIQDIDETHMETNLTPYGSSLIFKPGKYKTYGATRNQIKTLIETAGGYNSLTQIEKEISGRWGLVTDQSELDNLFQLDEQDSIQKMHNSHIKDINYGGTRNISNQSYSRVYQFKYNGNICHEILKVNIIVRATRSNTEYSVRLYDTQNLKAVVEKTGLNNTNSSQSIDLGIILYQPSTDTVLELQIKRNSGSGKIRFESMQLEYI